MTEGRDRRSHQEETKDPASAAAEDRLIVTAASHEYAPSLLALLGSLNLNWPTHPRVLVYDLGLDHGTRARLAAAGVRVRKIPPFCPHWREHYTWKLWCLDDAPARDLLWMDAGALALEALDEVFAAITRLGYFFVPNYELLDWEASLAACRGCGVPPEFRLGKPTLAGTIMGLRKRGAVRLLLRQALRLAHDEANIAATSITHRHDQALISLLAYKHLGAPLLADGQIYLGSLSPEQVPGQKLWVHRRTLRREDVAHFAAHLSSGGAPYRPPPALPLPRARARADLYRVGWNYGRGEHLEARRRLEAAFAGDPGLRSRPLALARLFEGQASRLQSFSTNPSTGTDYLAWVLAALVSLCGEPFGHAVERALPGARDADASAAAAHT
jgi:hypothetical protein